MSRRMVGPNRWEDEGPSGHAETYGARGANTVGHMRPIIRGSVLSVVRDHATDGAHTAADKRYSVRKENRW